MTGTCSFEVAVRQRVRFGIWLMTRVVAPVLGWMIERRAMSPRVAEIAFRACWAPFRWRPIRVVRIAPALARVVPGQPQGVGRGQESGKSEG